MIDYSTKIAEVFVANDYSEGDFWVSETVNHYKGESIISLQTSDGSVVWSKSSPSTKSFREQTIFELESFLEDQYGEFEIFYEDEPDCLEGEDS
jgi:hypothetical protein